MSYAVYLYTTTVHSHLETQVQLVGTVQHFWVKVIFEEILP